MTAQPYINDLLYAREVYTYLSMFVRRDRRSEVTAEQIAAEIKDALKDELYVFEHQRKEGIGRYDPECATTRLHPAAISRALFQKRDLCTDDAELNNLTHILEASFPVDPVTGFYAKHSMPLLVGLAHMHAQLTDIPVSLVEGDFSNMGGCNKSHVGREGTDKLINMMCKILRDDFAAYGKEHNIAVEAHGIRAGGDEVRLVVYGLAPEKVKEVLETRVHPHIQLLAAKHGVHTAPHEKKGKLPGFGVAFASVDLKAYRDPEVIRELLDAQIELQKNADGMLRLGAIDKAGVNKYVEEIYRPFLKHKGMKPDMIEETLKRERPQMDDAAKKRAALWAEMTRPGSAYPPEYHGVTQRPNEFFDALAKEKAAEASKERAAITLIGNSSPPFSDIKQADTGEAPESLRLRRAMRAFGFDELAASDTALFIWKPQDRLYDIKRTDVFKQQPQRARTLRLVIDLMRLFDAPDPVARCKGPQMIAQDTAQYFDRYKNEGGVKIAHFELGNVNGMNTVSPVLADAVLRETGKYLQDVLMQHSNGMSTRVMDFVYHEGGGKFKVMLPPNFPDEKLNKVKGAVQAMLHENVISKSPVEFAKLTYARSRPGNEAQAESNIQKTQQWVEKLEAKLGRPIATIGDIPHPKDARKKLEMQLYTEVVDRANVVGSDDKADPVKAAKALSAVGQKAEMAFEKSLDTRGVQVA